MQPKPEPDFGKPDALSPEWTEYETRWSVRVADFASPLDAARFLARRRKIFSAAAQSGFPKEMLAPFSPDKPGFDDRVISAVEELLRVTTSASKHAAE